MNSIDQFEASIYLDAVAADARAPSDHLRWLCDQGPGDVPLPPDVVVVTLEDAVI